MDTPSPHLDDDVLSAALDGALGPGDADAAHLAACETCRARRDQLGAAREALRAAPVEPPDELTRRRILGRALETAGARPRPWYLRPVLGGVAAALLVALAVTPFLLGRDGGSKKNLAATAGQPAAPFLGDLGDVSDPAALRAALGGLRASSAERDTARRPSADQAPKAAVPAPAGAPAAVPPPQENAAPYAATTGAVAVLDPAVGRRCADAVLAKSAKGVRLAATGVGLYRHQEVVVVAVSDRSGTTVFVLARDDCRVLERQQI